MHHHPLSSFNIAAPTLRLILTKLDPQPVLGLAVLARSCSSAALAADRGRSSRTTVSASSYYAVATYNVTQIPRSFQYSLKFLNPGDALTSGDTPGMTLGSCRLGWAGRESVLGTTSAERALSGSNGLDARNSRPAKLKLCALSWCLKNSPSCHEHSNRTSNNSPANRIPHPQLLASLSLTNTCLINVLERDTSTAEDGSATPQGWIGRKMSFSRVAGSWWTTGPTPPDLLIGLFGPQRA